MPDAAPKPPDWESLGVGAALLARYRQDQQALLEQLGTFLQASLPAQCHVRHTHGVLGPRRTTAITVDLDGQRYGLELLRSGAVEAQRTHVVRGVAVRTETLKLETWLDELNTALGTELERTTTGRNALARLLE